MLRGSAGARRAPDLSQLPRDPAIFQCLAASVPALLGLRCDLGQLPSNLSVAVIGAGAGTVPAVLAHVHANVTVHAVDIDAGANSASIIVFRCQFPCHEYRSIIDMVANDVDSSLCACQPLSSRCTYPECRASTARATGAEGDAQLKRTEERSPRWHSMDSVGDSSSTHSKTCAFDAGMLELGSRFLGVMQTPRLRLLAMDGLHFIADALPQSFDVVVLDVAQPAQHSSHGAMGHLIAPMEAFLGESFLGRALWEKMTGTSLLAVNVLGGGDHESRVHSLLSRCALTLLLCMLDRYRLMRRCAWLGKCSCKGSSCNVST